MAAKSKAWEAVELARTRLVVGQPFFGTLALGLELQEVDEKSPIQTMAVDGVHLYFNPKFVLKLGEEELKGVNAHEVMHCALKHMSRRGHRDPYKYNVAADYRINYDIVEAGFKLPGKPCGLSELTAAWQKQASGKQDQQQPDIHLYDKQFATMTTEEIYEKIPDPPGGGSGAMVLDLGGCGAVLDAGSGPNGNGQQGPQPGAGPSPAEADAIDREWDNALRTALAVERNKHAGNVPGYLERLLKQLKAPKVNWRDVTRQFIDQSLSKDYTYAKPNRRSWSTGLMLPGTIPDALHELVGIIDVSGSVSTEMATAMLSELAAALHDGVTDKLWVVYTDTNVRNVDEFYPGDLVTGRTVDGGGTNFDKVMKWVREKTPEAACIVFLTDMGTESFGEDPGIPTLWGVYNTEDRMASMKPPFGQMIHVQTGD